MSESQAASKSKLGVLVIFLIAAYVLLFALSFLAPIVSSIPVLNVLIPTASWDNVTLWILPLFGFLGIYFLLGWGQDFFKSKFFASVLFPIAFFASSLLSLFVAFLFLYMPASINTGRKIILCAWDCAASKTFYISSGKAGEIIFLEFWPLWVSSLFIYFVYSGILGWIAFTLIHKLEAEGKI